MSATVCLSFDNLGEAAEIGAGALAPGDPRVGSHPTATEVLPELLARLDAHELAATFFVEGLNAQIYPELLVDMRDRGHEVAYHAWAHEGWGGLSAAAQAESLRRGIEAFAAIGLAPTGLRPPGGGLGAGGVRVVGESGLRHCSPAGEGVGVEDGVAVLPFRWSLVDAACTLPQLASAREEIAGSSQPLGPAAFLAHLEAEIARLGEVGGFASIVLHPFMLEWLGHERLEALLGALAAGAARDELAVHTHDQAATGLLAGRPAPGGLRLDRTTWPAT